ncbi:elicitor-responsive protein 1-like isoform X1 [Lycium barbarum]|uniref:elicitor-responsive protein 1-like isoform X1 n=1 Tax=Lycium barbarum TaxID=112863 RepID=UPI00293EC045|nr:elicitor-responsive protein 1-like isoform X1 [Lycium barbarum]
MSIVYGVQGQLLEVTVVACNKLKDTEWISRQDPYVCLEYGSSKFRTRTCTDGGKNPTFQEKFVFTLIEGLREINIVVWNSNTVNADDFIGSGKVQLQKVLSQGYDDTAWPLQTKRGRSTLAFMFLYRHAGEVRLIMHYANANKPATSHAPSGSPYVTPTPGSYPYSAAPPHAASHPPPSAYPAPSPYSTVPPPSAAYHSPSPYPTAPPPSAAYHPPSYPPQSAAYPSPYSSPSAYPPQSYPPQGYSYPPGPYPGAYPPR